MPIDGIWNSIPSNIHSLQNNTNKYPKMPHQINVPIRLVQLYEPTTILMLSIMHFWPLIPILPSKHPKALHPIFTSS
ncbi:hypothetical protein HanXRQr2_Chr12g0552201 [Helianthus annuus]|uniref:Uncharacterized protein n=1 Tax=Helianthus annuus TaxID=4232 RepID=A0A9K3HID3_HELAN|nr:hypothetical protein HanXRQr2_Chr12g0552201 [Helianthus annuus]